MTYFPSDVRTIVEAIGVIFRSDGVRQMSFMRLLKLLYIADRKSFADIGRPIVGGPVFAMPRGPVLQDVYDLIKGQHIEMPKWSRHFRREGYSLSLCRDAEIRRLSENDIETLQAVATEHREKDEWELVEFTHGFAEWKKNDPGTSSKPITTADILDAVGRPGQSAKILSAVEAAVQSRRLLTGASK